ncbi:MAG: hypothetical protein OIF32_05910 [Campylobacterales bacterium]|nr:hypothetical protein [Campylobacterales bacterium]
MECLEQIEKLDIEEVSKKTHISILEIRAILSKDYASFNHSKAIGFTKIFKRDYDIDMSEWLDDFLEETGAKEVQDEIFVVSREKTSTDVKTKLLYLVVIIAIAAAISLIYSTVSSNKTPEKVIKNKEIVQEAKKAIETNKSTEEPKAITIEPKPFNPTKAKEEAGKLAPKVIEKKVEKVYIESKQDLWVGIRDNDTKKTKNKIFKGTHDLDPEKDYTITFGHGYFTLVSGEKREELRRRGPQKYRYFDGKFERLKYIPPKKKKKPEPKKEKSEEETTKTAEDKSTTAQ